MVEMVGVLEPDKAVHLKRISLPLLHYLVEFKAINCVSSKGEVAILSRSCRRIAVFLFGQGANVGFRSGFR